MPDVVGPMGIRARRLVKPSVEQVLRGAARLFAVVSDEGRSVEQRDGTEVHQPFELFGSAPNGPIAFRMSDDGTQPASLQIEQAVLDERGEVHFVKLQEDSFLA